MNKINYKIICDTREKENLHILKAFDKHNITYKKEKLKHMKFYIIICKFQNQVKQFRLIESSCIDAPALQTSHIHKLYMILN